MLAGYGAVILLGAIPKLYRSTYQQFERWLQRIGLFAVGLNRLLYLRFNSRYRSW